MTDAPTAAPVALEPCPFCGNAAKLIHDTSSDYKANWAYRIICMTDDCVEGSYFEQSTNAIAAWNRRPVAAQEAVAWRDILPLIKNVRDFLDDMTFNVPSDTQCDTILTALDTAIALAEKRTQVSDSAKSRHKEIMRLMREDFDPTPDGWEGRDWHDNAEDVADRIEELFR